MSTANVTMTESEFGDLRRIIYERAGIHFQDCKRYVLESRLSRRLEELGFDNFTQYVQFLTMGPYQHDEFQEMFNRITINETSFFRNEPQLNVFERHMLPKLLAARESTRTLRIWSAACSTGEEPYTLAIQVHRSLGLNLMNWRVEILGTDISGKALLVAERGRYGTYSLRTTSPLVLQRYFKDVGGESYQIDPTVRSMVHFEVHNLKETFSARRFGTWDAIFCRNVLIYFDDAMRTACARMFENQLADDGVLFIGHSETLRGVDVAFEPLPQPEAFAYVKQASGANKMEVPGG